MLTLVGRARFLLTVAGRCQVSDNCVSCEEHGPKTWPREVGGEVVVEEVADRRPGVTASYTGESGFSFGVRGAQHLEALEKPGSHPDNA